MDLRYYIRWKIRFCIEQVKNKKRAYFTLQRFGPRPLGLGVIHQAAWCFHAELKLTTRTSTGKALRRTKPAQTKWCESDRPKNITFWFHWVAGLEMSFHLKCGVKSHKIGSSVAKMTSILLMGALNFSSNKLSGGYDQFIPQ